MVHVVEGLQVGDFEAVDRAIDSKILLAEVRITQQIKLWFTLGLLGLIGAGALGFGIVIFNLGKMSAQFESMRTDVTVTSANLELRYRWMERKDILDDDMIQYLQRDGYTPPAWYRGRDLDYLGEAK